MIFASVLRSFTGFGFALAAVPLFSIFLPPFDVVVLTAALSLLLGFISIRTWWGVYGVREILHLAIMAVVGTILGTAILRELPVDHFQMWVGVAVLLACLALALSRPETPKKNPALGWGAGFFSGLMNGALAIPGPPMIIYALVAEFDPRRSRALLMMFFTLTSVFALLSYTAAGMAGPHTLWYFLPSLPALYVGDRLGNVLFASFGGALYRRAAVVVLALMGAVVILRAL